MLLYLASKSEILLTLIFIPSKMKKRLYIIQIELSIHNFQGSKVLSFFAIGKTEEHTQVSGRQFPTLRKIQFQNKFNFTILKALKL